MLETTIDHPIATITLNRPDKHNAFNSDLIAQLTEELSFLNHNEHVRVVILRANGKHFSAGADLDWMKTMALHDERENTRDAKALGNLFQVLHTQKQPTIALVNGSAFGGGIGLAASCDFVIANDDSQFCFSEARLGLAPATIAPFVIQKIGAQAARRHFLKAEPFNSECAYNIGLVDVIANNNSLDSAAEPIIKALLKNGPKALTHIKQLIDDCTPIDQSLMEKTAALIALMRVSDEGQAGMNAFLKKQPAPWIEASND